MIVDNYPEDKTEYFDVANNPNREANDTTNLARWPLPKSCG